MKKLIAVLVAFVFLVGLTYAQSSSAQVTQDGTTNNSIVDQTGGNHAATVNQYGTNWSDVQQSGGDHNSATVNQGASGAPVTNYYQPHYAHDWQNGAFITQIGSGSDATITITSSSNFGKIYQEGNYDHAQQNIGTSQSKTNNNNLQGVRITQTDGDHNSAEQSTAASFGCYGIQNMTVTQTGNSNVGDQYSIGGMGTVMSINQTGDNNNNPTQSGNAFNYSVSGLNITNPLNIAWAHKPAGDFSQYSNQRFGHAVINVTGNGNNTAQYQEYTVWSTSGANLADINVTGDLNNAAQGQLGESNVANISLNGNSNIAVVGQQGDSNNGIIVVTSNNNVAGISQINNGNLGTISQSLGNGNLATINQY